MVMSFFLLPCDRTLAVYATSHAVKHPGGLVILNLRTLPHRPRLLVQIQQIQQSVLPVVAVSEFLCTYASVLPTAVRSHSSFFSRGCRYRCRWWNENIDHCCAVLCCYCVRATIPSALGLVGLRFWTKMKKSKKREPPHKSQVIFFCDVYI